MSWFTDTIKRVTDVDIPDIDFLSKDTDPQRFKWRLQRKQKVWLH